MGAPQSQQIADRFHLILNLSATIERVLEERSRQLALPPAQEAVTETVLPSPDPEAVLEPRRCERRRHNCPAAPIGALRAGYRHVQLWPVAGGDRPRFAHGEKDHPTLASRRAVSRAETASPPAA
jgi:hypothetical protein